MPAFVITHYNLLPNTLRAFDPLSTITYSNTPLYNHILKVAIGFRIPMNRPFNFCTIRIPALRLVWLTAKPRTPPCFPAASREEEDRITQVLHTALEGIIFLFIIPT